MNSANFDIYLWFGLAIISTVYFVFLIAADYSRRHK